MGNNFGGKRKSANVMQLDGTSFCVKLLAAVADVTQDHLCFQLLNSEEAMLLSTRARLLPPDALLH